MRVFSPVLFSFTHLQWVCVFWHIHQLPHSTQPPSCHRQTHFTSTINAAKPAGSQRARSRLMSPSIVDLSHLLYSLTYIREKMRKRREECVKKKEEHTEYAVRCTMQERTRYLMFKAKPCCCATQLVKKLTFC